MKKEIKEILSSLEGPEVFMLAIFIGFLIIALIEIIIYSPLSILKLIGTGFISYLIGIFVIKILKLKL